MTGMEVLKKLRKEILVSDVVDIKGDEFTYHVTKLRYGNVYLLHSAFIRSEIVTLNTIFVGLIHNEILYFSDELKFFFCEETLVEDQEIRSLEAYKETLEKEIKEKALEDVKKRGKESVTLPEDFEKNCKNNARYCFLFSSSNTNIYIGRITIEDTVQYIAENTTKEDLVRKILCDEYMCYYLEYLRIEELLNDPTQFMSDKELDIFKALQSNENAKTFKVEFVNKKNQAYYTNAFTKTEMLYFLAYGHFIYKDNSRNPEIKNKLSMSEEDLFTVDNIHSLKYRNKILYSKNE